MNEESKKATKSGKYSALEISFIAISEDDVLCGSPEAESGVDIAATVLIIFPPKNPM